MIVPITRNGAPPRLWANTLAAPNAQRPSDRYIIVSLLASAVQYSNDGKKKTM